MAVELELTLKELTRSALGVSQLTNKRIIILHSLFDLILKKLDCSDEKVTIRGFEAKYFEELLKVSKVPTLPLNDDNVEVISAKLERLVKLEERLSNTETKLENHYEDIRRSRNMSDTTYEGSNWARYMQICEDLCRDGYKRHLLSNPDFIKKLLQIISVPIVERLLKLENTIDDMHSELVASMERFQIAFEKAALVKQCIFQIEDLRKLMTDNYSQFSSTLDEFQDQHDAKLSKEHMPALKKYVKDRIDMVEWELKKLNTMKDSCPKAIRAQKISDNCLSCGRLAGGSGFEVCSQPDQLQKKPKLFAICECGILNSAQNLRERMLKVEQETVARNISNSVGRKSIKFPETTLGSYDSIYF